jgi:hypothetical protein
MADARREQGGSLVCSSGHHSLSTAIFYTVCGTPLGGVARQGAAVAAPTVASLPPIEGSAGQLPSAKGSVSTPSTGLVSVGAVDLWSLGHGSMIATLRKQTKGR